MPYLKKKNEKLYSLITIICQDAYMGPEMIYKKLQESIPDINKEKVYNAIKQLKKHKILFQKGKGKGCKVSSYENNKTNLTSTP